MNFSDLLKRVLTACLMIAFLVGWLCLSHWEPLMFPLGLGLLWLVSLGEWWTMAQASANQAPSLRYGGTLLISLGFWSWWCVYSQGGRIFAFGVLIIAALSDSFAYFGGRIFQGPKLCPKLSPSKTWAGCLSSLMLTPLALYLLFSGDLKGEVQALGILPWVLVVPLCLAAQMGDLLESAAKRALGAKDSGRWLPGHGGLLDRLDSVLAIALVSALCLILSSLGIPGF